MNYFIIGMMGSWKSTVSKLLASKLHQNLIDIDKDIQDITGLPISGIFEFYGEQGFRNMESKYFEEICKGTGSIISTGGGVVLNKNNREILKSRGITFYLKTSAENLSHRIKNFVNRPLLDCKSKTSISNQLDLLLSEREDYYLSSSAYVIETDESNPQDIAENIADIINNERT